MMDHAEYIQVFRDVWGAQMRKIGADHGFYRQLDNEHKALFLRGNDTLVVTFDNLDDARQKLSDRLPRGVRFIQSQGWSTLGIAAHGWTWYRAGAVHDFFDALREGGFFNQFRQVWFYGGSMAGYAAAAFSSAAPGARVIALAPQATLDRDLTTGWESRYRIAWRRDFTDRYGYAPDHAAKAQQVWLFFDPRAPLDATHAALFRSPNVTRIRCRSFGHLLGSVMTRMGVLGPIVNGLISGELDEAGLYRLLRARHVDPGYQKHLLARLTETSRPGLRYRLSRAVLRQSHPQGRPHFLRQMNRDAAQLGWPRYQPPEI